MIIQNFMNVFKNFERKHLLLLPAALIVLGVVAWGLQFGWSQRELMESQKRQADLSAQLAKVGLELADFKNQDQVKINKGLKEEIDNINRVYKEAVSSFTDLLDLKILNPKLDRKFDEQLALVLNQLSDRKYTEAETTLKDLNGKIQAEKIKLAPTPPPAAQGPSTASVPTNNTPPSGGYARQTVSSERGSFVVDIISADLNSTRVIVDTASNSDCANDCPVLSLGEYAARSGAFAGINGSYFCPATYPQCAGKTNSFDTLLMNKNKVYFNSANNVYSTVPVVVFSGSSARFIGQSLQWGRDTGVDAVLANYPLLVSGGQNVYGGSSDGKLTSKGPRCFVGASGSTVYIGTIYSADMGDAAATLKAMGIQNALNLDEGGSTALWNQGKYLAGPGRNIPNALLLVRR